MQTYGVKLEFKDHRCVKKKADWPGNDMIDHVSNKTK